MCVRVQKEISIHTAYIIAIDLINKFRYINCSDFCWYIEMLTSRSSSIDYEKSSIQIYITARIDHPTVSTEPVR